MANVPGIAASHQIITPACRQSRTTAGAFHEAVDRIERLYAKYANADGSENVRWHLVLVREDVASDAGPAGMPDPGGVTREVADSMIGALARHRKALSEAGPAEGKR